MIDLHAIQGGASHGSYNGVEGVIPPIFWEEWVKNKTKSNEAIKTFITIMEWIDSMNNLYSLPSGVPIIHGVCPLNEPALGYDGDSEVNSSYEYLRLALECYYDRYIGLNKVSVTDYPAIYINVIRPYANAITVGGDHIKQFIVDYASSAKPIPANKVYLDYHQYIAWLNGVPSTKEGAEIAYNALNDRLASFENGCSDLEKKMKDDKNIYSIATSEWSAAYWHVSSDAWNRYFTTGVSDQDAKNNAIKDIKTIFESMCDSLNKHNIEAYFWSWKFPKSTETYSDKMPSGLEHSHYWSLEQVLKYVK